MKILMVAMNSIHFRRWTSQLEKSGHEIYWFDIKGAGGYVPSMDYVEQHSDWRLRIKKGRYFFKKVPFLKSFIEKDVAKAFEKYLKEVQPDLVHSFVLYMSCAPILEVMKKHSHIKWLYSAWGNDLYFYQNYPDYNKEIDAVLPHLDYMFADCVRDLELAKKLGFKGEILGSYPGGGGYHLDLINEPVKPVSERDIIFVKGYQGDKHRGLNVLKAIEKIEVTEPIHVFSASDELISYYRTSENLKGKDIVFYGKNNGLSHQEFCKLMNRSLLYIGNNLSDGMPNTMLEAICFGAFPIQSNPGGASAEIITNGKNGILIEDCEDIDFIADAIVKALADNEMLEMAFQENMQVRKRLDYEYIKERVLEKYRSIELTLQN
ncbi:MAG: glycosyltransferase [Flavobacteriaceae bacterium]|nr:glycosyltransferase [Flavobacteriaceae bacterium]